MRNHGWHVLVTTAAVMWIAGSSNSLLAQTATPAHSPVTYNKDVAPILQRACQNCHRPGEMGPMSLLTYEDARPWVRSIKAKVQSRQMPPWLINRNVGVQGFKNDPSLSDAEVATIVAWADSGAPRGDARDLPAPKVFQQTDSWHIGTPDLVVTSPPHKVPAEAADWWGSYVVDAGLTEDRYIKSLETKPGKGTQKVVHHLLTYAVEGDSGDSLGDDSSSESGDFLSEFAVGKNGDVFPEQTGRLLKAGSKIRFDFHYHSIGEEMTDQSQVAFVFYPKGYVPKHVEFSKQLGQPSERLDIPAKTDWVRTDGYQRFNKPGKMTAFQPHMHTRGKAQCIELIYPDNRSEQISCANWNFQWHLVAVYNDDVAPIYPAGTVLHVVSWHDNSVNKDNPDPNNWVGNGNRTIDEMGFAWISWYDLTDSEYTQELEARKLLRAGKTSAQTR